MSYTVSTQAFEGPFDLLLQLVSKQKLDIATISIHEVVEQYLQELERLKELELGVASDFILVATSLLEIKAASLLPEEKFELGEEDEDDDELYSLGAEELREVLLARLMAYKQFKNVSLYLQARFIRESYMHPRTAGPDPEFLSIMPDYLKNISLHSLGIICADLNCRKQSLLLEAEHIAPRRISIDDQVKIVQHVLSERKQSSFTELLAGDKSPETLVIVFLALLELFKRNKVNLKQSDNFSDIQVSYIDEKENES